MDVHGTVIDGNMALLAIADVDVKKEQEPKLFIAKMQ